MAINIGIVGLPNVGKSTLFNALSSAGAESANFPFCTIEPNVGVVPVPDARLQALAKVYSSEQVIPTSLEFVDIAGLVRGAAKGEGLGNQFLSHIRSVHAVAHVVRCFDDENVVHVDGKIDPVQDVEVIDTELILKDLDSIEKRLLKTRKSTRASGKEGEQAKFETEVMEGVQAHLEQGNTARTYECDDEKRLVIDELFLLTGKPLFFIANIGEADVEHPDNNAHVQALRVHAQKVGAPVVPICAGLEAEIVQLEGEEQQEFLESVGLSEPGLHPVIRHGYELLNLITFLTAGPKESRAWTVTRGAKAPQAAGVIHTDFERGFIRAEVIDWKDLDELGSEAAVKQAGKMRVEGKDYTVQDGDVMHFRFNV